MTRDAAGSSGGFCVSITYLYGTLSALIGLLADNFWVMHHCMAEPAVHWLQVDALSLHKLYIGASTTLVHLLAIKNIKT